MSRYNNNLNFRIVLDVFDLYFILFSQTSLHECLDNNNPNLMVVLLSRANRTFLGYILQNKNLRNVEKIVGKELIRMI